MNARQNATQNATRDAAASAQVDTHRAPPTDIRSITILGSTGSIGVSTLDVVARHPDRYRVHALTGHTRVAELAEQCRRFVPARAVVANAEDAKALRHALKASGHRGIQIDHGPEALCEVAREGDDPAPDDDHVLYEALPALHHYDVRRLAPGALASAFGPLELGVRNGDGA